MRPLPKNFCPRRILVIQLRQIGDVLLTTPALRALRRRFPDAKISFLVEPLPAKVLWGNLNLDELIIRNPKEGGLEPLRTIRAVRSRHFDLVIDYLGSPRTAPIALLSGAAVTVSDANRRRSFLYTHPVAPSGLFTAEQKLSLLAPFGIEPEPIRLEMALPDAAREKIDGWLRKNGLERADPLVVLEPFHKRWVLEYPAAGFTRLCELMVERWGAQVVVAWGPGREADARMIAESVKGLHLAPPTDLHEMAALSARAKIWVGNESGPRHIAASQGVPTFAVLGPTDDTWTPPGPRHLSVGRDDLVCRPCNKRFCPEKHHACMREFPAEKLFARLDAFRRSVEDK
jgi:ADP-heptose:LPS heptosyltransferase